MDNRLEMGKNKIMNALLERKGIQHILDTASEMLENPVFVGDTSYKVFFCSNLEEPEDSFWAEVQKKTFPKEKQIIQAFQSREFYDMYIQDEPVVALFPGIEHRLMGARYRDGAHVMGHIAIYELRTPFKEEDYELLKVLCKVLAYEMLYREKGIMQNVKYYSFFCDLLEKEGPSDQEVEEYIALERIKLPPSMVVAVLQSRKAATGVMLNYIREEILSQNAGAMAILYQKQILFLFDAGKDWESVVENYCERYAMVCGISYCFESLPNLRIHYMQAVRAIELSKKDSTQQCFNRYRDYALIDLIEGNAQAYRICCPEIFKLAEDDRRNHTENLQTLEVYLKSGGNIAKAADALCIHKNSLYYRISRIEQLLGYSLHDGDQNLLLYLSLIILQQKSIKPDLLR